VNLAGGKSDMTASGPKPRAVVRRIRGRVVDETGAPVRGAAVLIDRLIYNMGDSLTADAGVMSDADGRFDIPYRNEWEAHVLALHPRGWSRLTDVPAGRADAEVVVTIPASATLALQVKQGTATREADLALTQPGLRLGFETDERGVAEVALLAPGDYKLSVAPAQGGGANDRRRTEHPVSLAAGANDIDIDLPERALVVATARSRTPVASVEWFLDSGKLEHPTMELLRERHQMPGFEALGNGGYKLEGDESDDPMQFHELEAGTYTVCVDAVTTKQQHLPLACREVVVKGAQTVELEVAVGGR